MAVVFTLTKSALTKLHCHNVVLKKLATKLATLPILPSDAWWS